MLTLKRVTSELIIYFYGSRNTEVSVELSYRNDLITQDFHFAVHSRQCLISRTRTVQKQFRLAKLFIAYLRRSNRETDKN